MTISGLAAMAGVVVFPLLVVYAGLMDFFTMKIRNILVIALIVAWAGLAPLAGFGLVELGWNLGIAALVFAITFVFFALGWIGGGDAKLATATALWFDPQQALLYFTYASLFGGLLTLAVLQLRNGMLPALVYRLPGIAHLQAKNAGVPYGAAMAPAALIVMPDTAWVAHASF